MTDINTQVKASLDALMSEYTSITHNIANVSTVGFKRQFNAVSKELAALQGGGDEQSYFNIKTSFDFSQGSVTETGRSMDVALFGDGFFKIETPDGTLYTRNGMFHVNQNGQVVDSEGRMVAGERGAIIIPSTASISDLTISSDGSIQDGTTTIDKLKIVDFGEEVNKLVPAGMNCYASKSNLDPKDAANAVVKQGYLESSNVQIVDELVNLIQVSRLYQSNMKFLTTKSDNGKSIMSVAMG